MAAQCWTLGVSLPVVSTRMCEAAETAGWDGILLVDSQNLSGDTYIALGVAAQNTDRIGLGTGVTNPYTRHPAVTASAIAHVQAVSGGRAVLGIGRGDSSLAHLGLAPAPVRAFERYLERLQAYLRGDEVSFDEPYPGSPTSVDALGLAKTPASSRLEWLRPSQTKVPVDVAATGPKVIALAARVADRITLAVGADPERVAWALDVAREARRTAGLDPSSLSVGAYVNVGVHEDLDVARRLVSGSMSTFARFSAMQGTPAGPLSDDDRDMLRRLHDSYDMTMHTQGTSPQAATLEPAFMDRFGVVGSPDACVGRLRELVDLGIDRFVMIAGFGGRGEAGVAQRNLVEEVVPALR